MDLKWQKSRVMSAKSSKTIETNNYLTSDSSRLSFDKCAGDEEYTLNDRKKFVMLSINVLLS